MSETETRVTTEPMDPIERDIMKCQCGDGGTRWVKKGPYQRAVCKKGDCLQEAKDEIDASCND